MTKKRTAAAEPAGRPYGIFRVIEGGSSSSSQSLVRPDLMELVKELAIKAVQARRADYLIEKYAGGAGKDHPSRTADYALWHERQERWLMAAEAVAAFEAENIHEIRYKSLACCNDCNGLLASSILEDVLSFTGGAA